MLGEGFFQQGGERTGFLQLLVLLAPPGTESSLLLSACAELGPRFTWWAVLPEWAVLHPSVPPKVPCVLTSTPPGTSCLHLGYGDAGEARVASAGRTPGPLQPAKAGSDLAPVWCLQS